MSKDWLTVSMSTSKGGINKQAGSATHTGPNLQVVIMRVCYHLARSHDPTWPLHRPNTPQPQTLTKFIP